MFIRLAIRSGVIGCAVLGAFSIRAQEAVTTGPTVTAGYGYASPGDQRPDRPPHSKFRTEFQKQGSFGFLAFQTNSGADILGTMDAPLSWFETQIHGLDFASPYPAIFESSYDPFNTFDGPNGFAAAVIGLAPRLDDVVHAGSAGPDAISVALAPDNDQWKHGNNFEASMTARFVLGRKTQYPLTITFPAYVAVGDEQYFLGPHFGYISAGINFRLPLSFIPTRYGKWSVGSSADFCYYGTTTTEFINSIGLQIPKVAAALNLAF